MNKKILLTVIFFLVSCGSSIAYGDYVNTTGMSRKQIESIKNNPKTQTHFSRFFLLTPVFFARIMEMFSRHFHFD